VKTVTKKIASLFYLLIGIGPLLFVLFVSIKKEGIRHRMKQHLESRQLHTIILPENAVVWMDKHEIWVNNHMFDIHSKKLENGTYTFTGLYDDDETELVRQQQNTTEKDKQQNKLLAELLKCLPVFHTQTKEIYSASFPHHCYNLLVPQSPVTQYREILTPPPQVCC
jgi:hypothetical protein